MDLAKDGPQPFEWAVYNIDTASLLDAATLLRKTIIANSINEAIDIIEIKVLHKHIYPSTGERLLARISRFQQN